VTVPPPRAGHHRGVQPATGGVGEDFRKALAPVGQGAVIEHPGGMETAEGFRGGLTRLAGGQGALEFVESEENAGHGFYGGLLKARLLPDRHRQSAARLGRRP
jgi:hypothetical protein